MSIKIVQIKEHFEVYDHRGCFVLSADSYAEALAEIRRLNQASLPVSA